VIKISWNQGFKRAYLKKEKKNAELKDRFWIPAFAGMTNKSSFPKLSI